jgi:threonine aldolase
MQFGSDNQVGASQRVMDAVVASNRSHAHSYGNDPWTQSALVALKETFECDLQAYFVSTGTAANALALSCLTQPWETVLCHNHAHILNDESTAPEFFSDGARMIGISAGNGKLEPAQLMHHLRLAGTEYPHNARATTLSITQASENGLVYTVEEVRALCSLAHDNKLRVHMDGARFANAVAALRCTPADISWKAGVDVLCLGATKNGALGAEVVICFDQSTADSFIHRRKRSGHLLSKNRFAGAQMTAWLAENHYLELAEHANKQARTLAERLRTTPGVRITWPVQANEVFAILPTRSVERLRAAGAEFYEWPLTGLPPNTTMETTECYVRLVTSFQTSNAEIDAFISVARS